MPSEGNVTISGYELLQLSYHEVNLFGTMTARAWARGHRKRPARPSARLGFAPVDTTQTGQDLRGQEAARMKTVLYCRVSTTDQTLEHQRTQAEAAGYPVR